MGKNQFKDLTGQVFERLTVVEFSHRDEKNNIYWKCICNCDGKEVIIKGKYLRSGETRSCGCIRKEKLKEIDKKGKNKFDNVPTDLPYRRKLFDVWRNIIHRCYNKKNKHYKWYGARGINMCDQWLNDETGFYNFYHWSIKNGYEEGLSIDRNNVEENYSPQNCTWETHKDQCNNMTTNILIAYKNKTLTASQWVDELNLNIDAGIIRNRWQKGIRGKELFKINIKFSEKEIEINEKIKTAKEWSEFANIKYDVFRQRYNSGKREQDLIKPINQSKSHNLKDTINYIFEIINGEELSLKEISKKYNIKIDTLRDRYKRGLRGLDLIIQKGIHNINT